MKHSYCRVRRHQGIWGILIILVSESTSKVLVPASENGFLFSLNKTNLHKKLAQISIGTDAHHIDAIFF